MEIMNGLQELCGKGSTLWLLGNSLNKIEKVTGLLHNQSMFLLLLLIFTQDRMYVLLR